MAITNQTNVTVLPSATMNNVQSSANATPTFMFDIHKFMEEYNSEQRPVSAYFPVMQKKIPGLMSNVAISGTMSTDYVPKAEHGEQHGYSFIQIGKVSDGVANAMGGYGIAWRPLTGYGDEAVVGSPIASVKKVGNGEYDITMTSSYTPGGYTQSMGYIKVQYKTTGNYIFVPVQFGTYNSDGITINRCLIGNTVDLSETASANTYSLYLVRPNVYIVDFPNSIGDVSNWDSINSDAGLLSFVSSGVADIRPNNRYVFSLIYGGDGALVARIYESDGITEVVSLNAAARIPLFDFVDRDKADSFGISVYGTCGKNWYYDDIRIAGTTEQFPYLYCAFSPENIRDTFYVSATMSGDGSGGSGAKLYVAEDSGDWDMVGYTSASSPTLITSQVLSKDDYLYDGKINVLIVGAAPGDDAANGYIEIDDVRIINSESIGSHIGGCVDAYIDADTIEEEFTVTTDASGVAILDNSEYGIVHIIDIKNASTELYPSIDYILGLTDYSLTTRGSIVIKTKYASATEITVKALTSPSLLIIHSKSINSPNMSTGYDLLVRHKIIHRITVNKVGAGSILQTYVDANSDTTKLTMATMASVFAAGGIDISGLVVTDTYISGDAYVVNNLVLPSEYIEITNTSCLRIAQ